MVTATMRQPPYATHWSARRLAKQKGVSFMTVQRICSADISGHRA